MQKWEMTLGGRPLIIEYGQVAKQATSSVLVRYGDTVVLVTAVMASKPREGIDFFPLLVDYEERLYAVGKIPGGFIKREGRPPESAILAARMIDRPIRPLFPEGFRNDVQVVATVLSVEPDNEPSLVAMIGASAALHISEIPFAGPIGGVKIGRVDGKFVLNPTVAELEKTDMQFVVAGTKDAIMMVEAGAKEVSEDDALEGIMFAHEAIKEIVAFIEKIRDEIGKPKIEVVLYEPDPEIDRQVREYATDKLVAAIKTGDKLQREELIEAVKEETRQYMQEQLGENYEAALKTIDEVLETMVKEEVRKMIAVDKIRPDGRGLSEIRPISCAVGILPRAHGSGLFTRGQTQVLTVCTLGRVSEEQILDGLGEEASKRYIHHYNFPSFSVGEVRPLRSPGRREIGHGALAERALVPVIPSEEEFPYTIRLVSEVLESNGSSSQASVCGSTLALMDAGVPIKKPVAGVAMGLLKSDDDFAILTDIQGLEDHFGDMDFKVAGTKDGITAIQMDIKIKGIDRAILSQALAQAREGRLFILEQMLKTISEPREELSPYAPRIITFEIDPERIRDVIGPGGKMIRKIIEETGAEIDIEDDGRVFIAAQDVKAGEKAELMIKRLTSDVEVGASYLGKVTRLMNFGAFVEILPGKEGLVHISQLDKERVAKVEDVVNVGDEIMVKVVEIDKQGRINLSRKALLVTEE
ncbi:MAG TPA: polyribonucleotide nucleotidyltransferase [Bacillota bacterium]|jgi:polyribonucleotide nucleotidyltransferase|nr:polyribonucleotide nucleotidyltransferase [Bacillota bacterium]HOL08524.1 polyribonucleotide nucleotidyltransferase [Bacillota bacterium]HPO96995.1 polyribonucleotide nucleotidyltransferase [Bacillota bacterium]